MDALLKSTKTSLQPLQPSSGDFAIVCVSKPTAFKVLGLFISKLKRDHRIGENEELTNV